MLNEMDYAKTEYIKTIDVNGIKVSLGMDDYGQQYFIHYFKDGRFHEICLGAYNSLYMEEIYTLLDDNYARLQRLHLFGEKMSDEDWETLNAYWELFDREYENFFR